MKKTIILIILFFTTGCWNYRELNEFAVVTGMAIDLEDNQYKLSFLIANGNKTESQQTQTSILTGFGESIYDAFKDISLMSPKELYISHLSIVIISEEVARNGISNLIDYLMRDPQSHQNFYMVIAKEDEALDILSILSPLADYPSQNITSNVATSEKLQGKISDASFNLFITKYLKKGFEPIMNSVIIIGNKDKGEKPESQEKAKQDAYTKLDTIALFNNDKLVGWANKDESVGIDMILGEINTLYFDIPCGNGYVVTVSNDYQVDYIIKKKKITIKADAKGSVMEVGCNINLKSNKEIKTLEKKVEEKMKEYIKKAVTLAQKYNTDIFGFGNLFYKNYPEDYKIIKDWNTYFADLEIDIQTSFKYNSKGTLEQSIKKR